MKPTRGRYITRILIAAATVALLLGIWLCAIVRQDRLNHQLVVAINSADVGKAIEIVKHGADPDCSIDAWEHRTFFQRLMQMLKHRTGAPQDTAFLIACGAIPGSPPEEAAWNRISVDRGEKLKSLAIAREMIDHGALRADATIGCAAMEVALATGNGELVTLLHSRGVDINHMDPENHSALMLAAAHDDVEMVRLLIRLGAKVNQQDSAGYTALTLGAERFADKRVVEALLFAGADVQIKTGTGDDALSLCQSETGSDVSDLLMMFAAVKSPQEIPTGVPAIASLLGVTVGKDDLLTAYKVLGKPRKTGISTATYWSNTQHALTSPGWLTIAPDSRLDLNAVGFDSSTGILEKATWQTASGHRDPAPPPSLANICWMHGICPGMTKSEVESAISGKLPPPEKQGNDWHWSQRGYLRANSTYEFAFIHWRADLTFRGETLAQIVISARRGLVSRTN